jgi:NTP pyrophosphatase (non-canonical NTP hydrolase)
MDELIRRVIKFNKDRNWDQFHHPANLAKSISIEASELLENYQWSNNAVDDENVIEELADVMLYCVQMSVALNVDLEEIMNKKMDKNEKKYPVELAYNNSKKYNKL